MARGQSCVQAGCEIAELLAPRQLEYNVCGGSEAAVHAAQWFLDNIGVCKTMCPTLYAFTHSAYAAPSNLFWPDKTISFAEGVQQGDPLGLPVQAVGEV